MPPGMGGFGGLSFTMRIETPGAEPVADYLRTADFESTELKVHWTDSRGQWTRQLFASRPDDVVVQRLVAPAGQPLNVKVSMQRTVFSGRGPSAGLTRPGASRATRADHGPAGLHAGAAHSEGSARCRRRQQRLRRRDVVLNGGTARIDGGTLIVEHAASLTLLTRIAHLPDYSEDCVDAVYKSLEQIVPDYDALLGRARSVQSEMLHRVSVDFGGAAQHGLSSEELLSEQRSSPGYCAAFLETLFDMCRYWFILSSGRFLTVSALTNININLQTAPGVQGDHREGMDAYFAWMESLYPDYRSNARNIFGMRGSTTRRRPPRAKASRRCSTWPAPRASCGPTPTGSRPGGGASVPSGIGTSPPATSSSSEIGSCRRTRTSRSSTRTSSR